MCSFGCKMTYELNSQELSASISGIRIILYEAKIVHSNALGTRKGSPTLNSTGQLSHKHKSRVLQMFAQNNQSFNTSDSQNHWLTPIFFFLRPIFQHILKGRKAEIQPCTSNSTNLLISFLERARQKCLGLRLCPAQPRLVLLV